MIRDFTRICMIIVACFVSDFAELVIKPKDTESIVGGSAYFNCSTTDPTKEIQWFHYYPGSPEKNMVYGFGEIRGAYEGRFSVKSRNITGEFNLVIIAVIERDAGTFECQDEVGNGNKSQAELIVLEKPICRPDMPVTKIIGQNACGVEPDIVRLSCIATYLGNIAPVLQWGKVGESDPITQNVAQTSSVDRVIYNLTLKGDTINDGSVYSCQTTRSSSVKQFGCVSDAIRILSPQNEFSITERKLGDQVQCPTVIANSCSYRWLRTDPNGDDVVSTNQLLKLDVSGLYRCEAHCMIKTRPCTLSAMIVHVPQGVSTAEPYAGDGSAEATSFKIAFIVVLILLVACAIMFLVCFVRWHRIWKSRNRLPILELQPLQVATNQGVPFGIVYSPNPTRLRTIKTASGEANDRSIKGLAVLNNEVFIISQLESEVEVYDCTTLSLRRRWQLQDLGDPDDATACVRNRCIYISDNRAEGKEIFRVDADGNVITRWPIGAESGRLSVSNQSNVILSQHDSTRLKEYSPEGILMREINLQDFGLTHPMHVVSLVSGNYVITQGYLDDPIHRLCEVNHEGRVIRSFGAEKGSGNSHVTNPMYLAVDREGSIMVADAGNGRVLLLDSNLHFRRELITKSNGLHIPTRIALDEINGYLFVAEYKRDMRSLLVFSIR